MRKLITILYTLLARGEKWDSAKAGLPGAIAPTATALRVQEISIFSMFIVTNIVLGAIPEDSVK